MNSLIEELMIDAFPFLKLVSDETKTIFGKSEEVEVKEILSYQLTSEGHLFRPFLVALTAQSVRGQVDDETNQKLVHFASAIELMHNASLIHDDMIDNENFRRGKECLHKKYGYKNAILTGNSYYIYSIQISNAALGSEITEDILSTAFKMCVGEMLQAQYEDLIMPDDIYFEVIKAKTAGLTALACKGAAKILGLNNETIDYWEKIGELIGVIYQMKDDGRDKDTNLREDFDFDCFSSDALEVIHDLLDKARCEGAKSKIAELVKIF